MCWGLTSQSTIFQSCRDGAIASWVINQYFRGVKCLAQGHNTAEVGLEPRTSRSGVRHSTTEPPRSPTVKRISLTVYSDITLMLVIFSKTHVAYRHLNPYENKQWKLMAKCLINWKTIKSYQSEKHKTYWKLMFTNSPSRSVSVLTSGWNFQREWCECHYRLMTFNYFTIFSSSKRHSNSYLMAQKGFGYCNFLGTEMVIYVKM